MKIYETYIEKEKQEKAKKAQVRKTGSKRGWNLRKKMMDGHYGRFLGTNSKKRKRK
ncbi:MAG: hypothetical protein ACFFG0_26355 [Candidatus Thorarchaeota archaeon]